MTKSKTPQLVYQLHIRLMGSEPEIWRRVLVPAEINLNGLHQVIQNAFEWENYHLYQFAQDTTWTNRVFPQGDDDIDDDIEKYYAFPPLLSEVLNVGEHLFYTYDFGDDWQHDIFCEALMVKPPRIRLPYCLDGKNHSAFEDVGGVWGYKDMLDIIKNQDNPDYAEAVADLCENYGRAILSFDATVFNARKIKFERTSI